MVRSLQRRLILAGRSYRLTHVALLSFYLGCSRLGDAPDFDARGGARDAAKEPVRPKPSTAPSATHSTPDAGAPKPPVDTYVGATGFQALIMSEMEWPASERTTRKKKRHTSESSKSIRLGYMRRGAKALAIPELHKKKNCVEGWVELAAGGFLCSRYATLDLSHPKFKVWHPPDAEGPLPYTYGINGSNGTPLYRSVPSREERREFEPWLKKPKKAKGAVEDNDDATAAPSDDASQEKLPWYLQEHDAGAPNVTLEELQEETDGAIAKRMVKGFYLSLDERFTSNDSSWWKTQDGLVAPADRVWVAKPGSDHHGVWLGQDRQDASGVLKRIMKLPLAFIVSRGAKKWSLSSDKKSASAQGPITRYSAVALTGEHATLRGKTYEETDEGFWVQLGEAAKTEPGPPPEKIESGGKWIDVNLERQTLVAFEGDKAVFATVFSSGRKDHETPPGTFRIREKHISATMDGNADTAADGPYSIQDVPYIQYFNSGYALHGAFWHNEFGRVKSHGCVNLAPLDAKALFAWTGPELPEGWHGVWSSADRLGAWVVVH